MMKKYDKEKVIKILTKEEANKINAFNIVPNLSDKVLDYNEKVFNFTDIVTDNLEEKRKYNSKLEIALFVMAGMQARMKQQFSISELSLALTSEEVINKLNINIEYDKDKSLLKEANVRAFLNRYEQNDKEEIEFNNDFIKFFNKITKSYLSKAGIESNIHILDCSVLDVNLDNCNYEGSSVTYKGGKKLRGYKIGLLRGVTPNGGVTEEICMSTAKNHDLDMSKEMIINTKYLKEGDYLLEDRGFLDILTFRKLVGKKINVIIPIKKNMEIYKAAKEEAISKNEWKKHPNSKRKGQDIVLVENLELFWLTDNDKTKKIDKVKLEYKINACVIRFDKKLNKKVLTDEEIIDGDEKYAYAVIITNDTNIDANEIIRLYEMRSEIEEDFRQLKDFWGLNTYKSTKYIIISFIIMLSLLSYNLYQVYKESEEGKSYIGKNFIVEERKGLYIVKGVRTAIIVNDYFAIFYQDELLDLYVDLSKKMRDQLKQLLTL